MTKEKMLEEAYRPIDKVMFLVRNGLGRDQTKLTYYNQAIQNPYLVVQNPAFRTYAAELLDNLASLIFTDPILYARVAALLVSKKRPASPVALKHPHRARIRPRAWESLQRKAEDSKIPLRILVEVYDKGFVDPKRPMHLTQEQFAYNRVNSYIANGKARRLEEQELVNSNERNTLKTIQKVVRNRK